MGRSAAACGGGPLRGSPLLHVSSRAPLSVTAFGLLSASSPLRFASHVAAACGGSPLSHRVRKHPVTAPPRGEPSVSPWVKVRLVVRESPKNFALPQTLGRRTHLHLPPPAGLRSRAASCGRGRRGGAGAAVQICKRAATRAANLVNGNQKWQDARKGGLTERGEPPKENKAKSEKCKRGA